jgi:hypothetical protein
MGMSHLKKRIHFVAFLVVSLYRRTGGLLMFKGQQVFPRSELSSFTTVETPNYSMSCMSINSGHIDPVQYLVYIMLKSECPLRSQSCGMLMPYSLADTDQCFGQIRYFVFTLRVVASQSRRRDASI